MLANYHTHTSRCHHASGMDEEYIQKAIAEGVKILGFSDHAPYLYPHGYNSYYKMTPEESTEYFSTITALRERYRDKIEIHIGYEAEYYPDIWDATFEFWKNQPMPPEYLILGQHFLEQEHDEKTRFHSSDGSDDPDVLKRYVDLVIAGINTGRFTYIAHPDLFGFYGSDDPYFEEMCRLMTEVKRVGIPLEINLLGLSEGRNYPSEKFWRFASEYSPKVIFGCDAHVPKRVAVAEEVTKALRFADKYHLEVLDVLTLKDPFRD